MPLPCACEGDPSWRKDAGERARPGNSYGQNSQATVTSLARAELRNQRSLNDESPRSDGNAGNLIIPHVQLPMCSDEGSDDSCSLDQSVAPEDSITGRGRITKRPDETRMCEREMAELRKMVNSDSRFGAALERTCQAVYECISMSNPSPILALLASLVWRSLCIAWELEPQTKLPKTHLRSKVAGLQDKQQHMTEHFDDARSRYLKELVALRDQVRKLDGHALAAVHQTVYTESPVMYYEPLQYVGEKMRGHIVEIVEEKLKLLVAKMQDKEYVPPPAKPVQPTDEEEDEGDDKQEILERQREAERRKSSKREADAARKMTKATSDANLAKQKAEDAAKQLSTLCEEKERAVQILTREFDLVQGYCTAAKADLSEMAIAARQEWEDISSIVKEDRSIQLVPPPQLRPTSDTGGADVQGFSNAVREMSQYIAQMLAAGKQVRRRLTDKLAKVESDLQREKTKTKAPAPVAEKVVVKEAPAAASAAALAEAAAASAESSKAEVAAARKAAAVAAKAANERDVEFRQALEVQENGRKEAENRAEASEKEQATLRAEIKRLQMAQKDSGSASAELTELASAKDKELEAASKENAKLSDEVERLRALIEELSQDEGQAKEKLQSIGLVWRKPTKRVFERLFQDSVDRQERKKNLISSLAQARDEHALDIFRSSLDPFYDFEVPSTFATIGEHGEPTSFCPGILKSQRVGWVGSTMSPPQDGEPGDSLGGDALRSDETRLHRSPSPQPNACVSFPLNGMPTTFPNSRSRSPVRSSSPNPELGVKGRKQDMRSRSSSPVEQLRFSSYVAALGVACNKHFTGAETTGVEASRPPRVLRPASPSSNSSRPSSAGLHRAKATIIARPRSAALPAIQKLQRAPTEAALFKEGQRLLAAPANPAARLGRSSSAPGIRAVKGRRS